MVTAKEYEKQVIENSLRHNGLARIANGTEARLNELLTAAIQSNAPELPVHGPTLCDALNISRNLSQEVLDFAAFLLKDAGYEISFDPKQQFIIVDLPHIHTVKQTKENPVNEKQMQLLQFLHRQTGFLYLAVDSNGNTYLFENEPNDIAKDFIEDMISTRYLCLDDTHLPYFLNHIPNFANLMFKGISLKNILPPQTVLNIHDL